MLKLGKQEALLKRCAYALENEWGALCANIANSI